MEEVAGYLLTGKKAIVTGGASGIGKAIANAFARAGADVAIVDLNLEDARQEAQAIKELGRDSLAVKVDVANQQSVEKMAEEVYDRFGRIDVLVNSAGVNRRIPAEDLDEKDWDAVLDINLKGTFLCCKYAGRKMIAQKGGNIINLASMSGMIVNKDRTISAYCASKGGVVMLTKALAVEWAKHNIRVNALAPGYIVTPINPWMSDTEICRPTLELVPMQRFGEISEIYPAALFLASAASSYITGTILPIDGGYMVY